MPRGKRIRLGSFSQFSSGRMQGPIDYRNRFARAPRRRLVVKSKRRLPSLPGLKDTGPEAKYFDTGMSTYSNMTVTTAVGGVVIPINTILQGGSAVNRIGNKVNIHSVHLKGTINFQLTSNFAGAVGIGLTDFVMIALVVDEEPNGTAATVDQIWQTAAIAGASAQWCGNAQRNMSNISRFKILQSDIKCLTLNAENTVVSGFSVNDNSIQNFEMYFKKNDSVQFLSGTTAIPTKGAYYFVISSYNEWANSASGDGGRFTHSSRVVFSDD